MKRPNVVFILADALRPRNLGCYGYSKPTSQNIDRLATEGVVFENAFSCAINTTPSLTSIFSGRYPLSHGIARVDLGSQALRLSLQRLNKSGTVLLPEILKSHGYRTLAVDWLGRWHKRGYDYYSGVTSRRYPRAFSLANKLNEMTRLARLPFRLFRMPKIRGDFVTQEAAELIKKVQDERFFLFVHYWDTHTPYDPPERFLKPFKNSDYRKDQSISEVLAEFRHKNSRQMKKRSLPPGAKTVNHILERYDGAIAFVDHEIGRLVGVLEDCGVLDETLIIFTSDHGESLTEHGIYWTHHGLYDVTINVPLIFRYSHFPSNKRVEALVQHTDLVPTILDAVGVDDVELPIDGKSLIPLFSSEVRPGRAAIYAEEAGLQKKRAIRTRKFKYIYAESEQDAICRECGRIHGGVEELYDLQEDPGENHNIVDENPGEKKKLKKRLFEWMELCVSRRDRYSTKKEEKTVEPYPTEEEEEIRKRLRELGYI